MGDAEALVLVPGLLCDEAVWHHQAARLGAGRELHVAAHGMSDSLEGMADRILAAAPPRFALAGHSMGGRVALEVVARAPQRVSRLALLDTGYTALAPGEAGERERASRYRLLEVARKEGMRAMGRLWAHGMVHPARRDDLPFMDGIYDMIERAGVARFAAQIHALLARPDRTALLSTLRVPTLLLCGHDDQWSPYSRHEAMARLIPGSVLVGVEDCGHMSPMEKPDAVSQALAVWLASEG